MNARVERRLLAGMVAVATITGSFASVEPYAHAQQGDGVPGMSRTVGQVWEVATNAEFQVTVGNLGHTFKMVEGADAFRAPIVTDTTIGWRPKSDAAGSRAVVVRYDKTGKEDARYNIRVVPARDANFILQTETAPAGVTAKFEPLSAGNTWRPVSGLNGVTVGKSGGAFTVMAKPEAVGQVVVFEELNPDRKHVRTIRVTIVDAAQASQSSPGTKAVAPYTAAGLSQEKEVEPETAPDTAVIVGVVVAILAAAGVAGAVAAGLIPGLVL